MAEDHVPVEDRIFGDGYYLRPQFIQPYKSKNVLIEGVTILNSPMWIVHPVCFFTRNFDDEVRRVNKKIPSFQVLCENVIIRNINITR